MSEQQVQIGRAALWMTGAIASFSTMAIAGREASFTLDTFEIMMYRSAIGVFLVAVVLTATGKWHRISGQRLGSHLIRNAAHFTGQNLWFFAITMIPLAQVFALEFTSPLWVILLSPFLLGEPLTRTRSLAAMGGFIGILIVARPSPETMNIGVIAASSSAIFFAVTNIMTKRLTRVEHIGSILLWLTTMQLVMGVLTAGYDGDIALPDISTAPWLILIGVSGLTAHFCLTNALSVAPATVVIPIDFTRLPVIGLLGMLIYNEPLDIWVLCGAIVIFAANYMNIMDAKRIGGTRTT